MLLQAVKRARSPDAETGPAKRKVRSCDTCRRLKTRCEIQTGSMVCHRCSLLRLECSLDSSTTSRTPTREAASPKTQENHSQPCSHSDCNQRLLAVEASLAEVKALLDSVLHTPGRSTSPEANRDKAKSRNNESSETGNITSPKQHQHSGPLVADRNSRTAPMSLIRDMKQHILGRDRGWHDMELSEDIVKKGIITEELTQTLLSGFTQLSRRWLFMRPLPAAIRQTSPLLFASCVLAGLHINPSLHGSETHHQLYQHVSTLLSKSMIVSPLSLEAIQSMLIFSMWNLVPNKDAEHLDTWLLSGIAGMHGMLAINFEKLVQTRPDGLVDPRSRETLRSWNLICLCHLQFSVGTGRPPVLSRQYLNQCETILSLPSYNFRDQLVAAGVKLYDSLCCLVNSDTVQTDSLVWEEIDDWKKSCGQFYELDSSKPLRFAYSCSYLILARRTLKHLSEEPAKDPTKTTNGSDLDPTLFFQLAVEHAHRILNLFLAMSDLTAFVRPAYENLLCSFAMVTLSEFAAYLEDVDATLALMEKTSLHVQLGGKAEPVSKWALNVLRKYVFDLKRASAQDQIQQQDGGDFGVATDQEFGSSLGGAGNMALPNDFESSEWGVDQDFPSLEDMFVGN